MNNCRLQYLKTCNYCNKQFTDEWKYKAHIRAHANNEKGIIYIGSGCSDPLEKCKFCHIMLQANDRYDHILAYHEEQTFLKKCGVCNKVLLTETEYKIHIRNEHDRNKRQLQHRIAPIKENNPVTDSTEKIVSLQENYFVSEPTNIETSKLVVESKREGEDLEYNENLWNDSENEFESEQQKKNKAHRRKEVTTNTKENSFVVEHSKTSDERIENHKYNKCTDSELEKQIAGKMNTATIMDIKGNTLESRSEKDTNSYIVVTEPADADRSLFQNSVVCKICKKQFASFSYLKLHFSTHKCELCDVIFVKGITRYSDMKSCHPNEMGMCKFCDSRFRDESSKDSHMNQMHPNSVEEQPPYEFQCSLCENYFASSDSLKQHMNIHSTEKAYMCDVCKSSFSNPYALTRHKKKHVLHTGNKLPKCETCERTFTELRDLKRHQLTHERSKPFCCKFLPKRFKMLVQLREHEEICQDPAIRKFPCETCGHRFKTNIHLKNHMLRCHGEKRHLCDICNKLYSRKDRLMAHMATHGLEKQFKCERSVAKNFIH